MTGTERGLSDDPGSFALHRDNLLPNRIREWANVDPDRTFLVEADGERRETYGSFHESVQRWARLLVDRGVRPGDRVVTLLPSSVDSHAVWLALAQIGSLEVPVNPELRGEFLSHVLSDSGGSLCVARPAYADLINSVTSTPLEVLIAERRGPSSAKPLELGRLQEVDDISCIIYTSGTTGPSKGVAITWSHMAASVGRLPRNWLSENDAVYSPWPMFHVTGRTPMFAMADVGGRVVTRERFSLSSFWRDVRSHHCTSATVTTVASLLVAEPPCDDERDHPLRHVLFGRVGPDGLRFIERFGVVGVACYGSTEVGFPIVNRAVDAMSRDVAGWLRHGYEAAVIGENGQPVKCGDVGELWIRPPDRRLIMSGYFGHPEQTSRAVVDGWYHTGDAVRQRDDGGFVFIDRMRDTIRRFGENISSTALEHAIVADPEVLECACVGAASAIAGQDIVLVVVPMAGVKLDPAALDRRLSLALPRFMRPNAIAVVESLPKTPNGKVRKVMLASEIGSLDLWRAPA